MQRTAGQLVAGFFGLLLVIGPAAQAAEYFVDRAHPSARDAGPGTADAPWQSLGKAASALQPGDTATIASGIYREQVSPGRSGTPNAPITYRAAPGARVVVSGADAVTGWQPGSAETCPGNPHFADIYYADIDWRPPALFADGVLLPMARTPNEGWWVADGGGLAGLSDAAHLTADPATYIGAEVFWWDVDTTSQIVHTVTASDGATLTMNEAWGYGREVEAGKDRYYLRGRLAFLDRPGEWAVEPRGDGFRLFLWPPDGSDPNDLPVEATHRGRFLVEYGDKDYLVFDGLEVCQGAGHGIGSWTRDSTGITIRNCDVHDNLGNGIYLRFGSGLRVTGCRVTHNGNGITGGTVRDVIVEGCDVAHNDFDGVVFSHDSQDVVIRHNLIRGHNRWGHPDNIQLHNGLSNIRIEENVLFDGGQALMMQETTDGVLARNLIVGAEAYAIIPGHNSVERFTIDHNTIALCGWGAVNSSNGTHTVTSNILAPGQGSALSSRDATGLTSARNLFWGYPDGGSLFAVGGIWTPDLAKHQEHTGLDAASLQGAPGFVSAPKIHGVMDNGRLAECTRSRLYLRTPASAFAVGDRAEVGFDGVIRDVTAVAEGYIEVSPELRELPEKAVLVLNWGDGSSTALDFRLRPDSPARGAGAAGSDIGCPLAIADLRDAEAVLAALKALGD
jgi:parallel beta-helix repeat protein